MTRPWLLLFFLFHATPSSSGSKLRILLTAQNIAYSHVSFQKHLADILAQEGHYVRLAIHELRPISKVNAKYAQVTYVHSSVAKTEKNSQQDAIQAVFMNKTAYDDHGLKLFANSAATMCKDVLSNNEYKNLLKEEHFDVAIGAEVDVCSLVLFKMLGIEAVIITSPMPLHDQQERIFGIPIQRSYNTYIFNGDAAAPNLSFWKRLQAVYKEIKYALFNGDYVLETTQELLDKEYGKGKYNLRQMIREVDLVITNGHELVDIARLTTSKVVKIGGLAVAPPEKLSPKLESIMLNAKHGVVLFSWGSQVDLSTLPRDLKLNLFNAFSKFPEIEFVLKYDRNQSDYFDIIDRYPNLHPFKWLHQTSILAHPKTKAFITHGGRNSLIEAVKFAVPTISCPLFADQQYNSAVFQHRGIGMTLEITSLSQENLIRALKQVLYNPRIRKNSHVLKAKLDAFPDSPRQKFINWVEYVAKFKSFPEFDLPGATMNTVILHNLDVYVFLLAASTLLILIAIFVTHHVTSFVIPVIQTSIPAQKLKVT